MKFGEYLQSQQVQEWKASYLNYDKLKKMIKQLEEIFLMNPQNTGEKGAYNYALCSSMLLVTDTHFLFQVHLSAFPGLQMPRVCPRTELMRAYHKSTSMRS